MAVAFKRASADVSRPVFEAAWLIVGVGATESAGRWHPVRLAKSALTRVIVVRRADDAIVGFQHEARTFVDELKERMGQFELASHPDKARASSCRMPWSARGWPRRRIAGSQSNAVMPG